MCVVKRPSEIILKLGIKGIFIRTLLRNCLFLNEFELLCRPIFLKLLFKRRIRCFYTRLVSTHYIIQYTIFHFWWFACVTLAGPPSPLAFVLCCIGSLLNIFITEMFSKSVEVRFPGVYDESRPARPSLSGTRTAECASVDLCKFFLFTGLFLCFTHPSVMFTHWF